MQRSNTRGAAGLLALALVASCDCGGRDPDEMDGAGPDEVDADDSFFDGDVDAWAVCSYTHSPWDETLVAAAHQAFTSFEDGTLRLPLTTDRCFRVERVVSGGAVTRLSFVAIVGLRPLDTDPFIAPLEVRVAEWTRDGDGVLRGAIDADSDPWDAEDDFREIIEIEDFGARRRVREVYDSSTRALVDRLTLTMEGELVRQVREADVDGTVAVVESFLGDDRHSAQGGTLSCLAAKTECDPGTAARFEMLLGDAVATIANCMSGLGNAGQALAKQLEVAKAAWARSHRWMCFSGTCAAGQWCTECQLSGRPLEMAVNTAVLGYRDMRQQVGTVGHELLHGIVGLHPDEIVESNVWDSLGDRQRELMRVYTDPVVACERLCFGTTAVNPCSCAACLGVKACSDECRGLGSCREDVMVPAPDGSTMTVAIMSEAVGSACITRDPGGNVVSSTFFPTMAECMSMCSGSMARCKSYSLSCDETCQ